MVVMLTNRSMEIQLTDFENAAFTVFIILLTRIILAFDLHLYIPISKVDENMARAHKRNGVLTQKFWFRKYLAAGDVVDEEVPAICKCMVGTEVEEMTIAEVRRVEPELIMLGTGHDDQIGAKVAINACLLVARGSSALEDALWFRSPPSHGGTQLITWSLPFPSSCGCCTRS